MRPRECLICGKPYTPKRVTQATCLDPVCRRAWKNQCMKTYNLDYIKLKPEPPREPKKDTIIAIGYAERQIAKTLEMAGKVKVEL